MIGVIGEGLAALGALAILKQKSLAATWVPGSAGYLQPPLPVFQEGEGARFFHRLCRDYEIETGVITAGPFQREFKNKSFQVPEWSRDRAEAYAAVWGPERTFLVLEDAQFERHLLEIQRELREKLSMVERGGTGQVMGLELHASGCDVVLDSGKQLAFERVIYADKWSLLDELGGVPRHLMSRGKQIDTQLFTQKWQPTSALQVVFEHETGVGAGVQECFFGPTTRDASDSIHRHVMGSFAAEGKKSIWNIFLESEESESNHEISKKLRKVKQTLNKMFVSDLWLPPGKKLFTDNVVSEHLRFEAGVVFGAGEPVLSPAFDSRHSMSSGKSRVTYLTDGFGPSATFSQLAQLAADF